MTTESTIATRRVLVVELAADVPFGHFPVAFAELATELTALGCEVEAFTRRGWHLDGDPAFAPLVVHHFGPRTELAFKWGARLEHLRPRALGARLGRLARTAVSVSAARRLARRYAFTDVVLVSWLDAPLTSLLARDGRWLSYQFDVPGTSVIDRLIGWRSRRVASRDACRVRVATSVDVLRDTWAASRPWLDPVTIPFIAARPRVPDPGTRAAFDLPPHQRVALLFGVNPSKDLECAGRALRRLPEWQLVVAGGRAADAYRTWAAANPHDGPPPILVDGFVDDATRAALHAAADVVVLSFRPDVRADSGNLVDAIAAGTTVVCSDGCPSADVVRHYSLGPVFAPGDASALRAALEGAPAAPDPDGLAAARAAYAPARVAARNLAALDAGGAIR